MQASYLDSSKQMGGCRMMTAIYIFLTIYLFLHFAVTSFMLIMEAGEGGGLTATKILLAIFWPVLLISIIIEEGRKSGS